MQARVGAWAWAWAWAGAGAGAGAVQCTVERTEWQRSPSGARELVHVWLRLCGEPGEVELTLKMNPGTRKEDIDVIFNYQRLRIFVGASEKAILDDRLFNPILTEGCTWTYNERSRKLEISMTKDSDTVVWCAAFIYKDADGNLPTINEDHEAERTRMERFLPKRS